MFCIFPFVAKSQVYDILPSRMQEHHRVKIYIQLGFIVLFLGFNTLSIFVGINPGSILSFLGAVMCWFIAFTIPFLMLLKW